MASRGIDTFDTGINDSAVRFDAPTAVAPRGPDTASTSSQAFAALAPLAVKGVAAIGEFFSGGNQNEAFLIREMGGKLQAIENARQAGQISGMTASSRGRQAYQDIMMLNPQYKETINEFFKGNRAYGIAESIEEASNQEEDQIAKFRSDIISNGFGLPTDSPEQQERSGIAFSRFKAAESQMKILTSTANLSKLRAEAGNAAAEAQLKRTQAQTEKAVNGFVASAFEIAVTKSRELTEMVKRGEITPEEGKGQYQTFLATNRAGLLSSAGGLVSEARINGAMKPLEDLTEVMSDAISGKLSLEQVNNKNQLNVASAKYLMNVENPLLPQAEAVYQMFGPNPVTSARFGLITNGILDGMTRIEKAGTGGIPPVTLGTGADVKELFSTIDGALLNNPPEKMTNQVNGTLDSLILYGDRATNVTELGHLMGFLSGAGMRSFIQKGGTIDPARASQAAEGVGRYYDETVLRTLKNTFINKSVSIYSPGSRLDLSVADERASPETYESMSNELVVLDMKNGLFSFAPKQGLQGDAAREARNTANEMNKQAVPLLNKLAKLDAHLGGHIDYQSSALRLKGRLEEMMYPEGRPGLKIGGMEGNDAGIEIKK